MHEAALSHYEQSLREQTPLRLVTDDGKVREFDVRRWCAGIDIADLTVLARCQGSVLDVGCGPGRFVHAAHRHGLLAVGIDIAATAVAMTRRDGGAALHRSVFDPALDGRRWSRILLMDGNIGIGANVGRLLERVRELLAPDGRLLVETAADDSLDHALRLRVVSDDPDAAPEFGWAEVGVNALRRYATAAALGVDEVWRCAGRSFAALVAISPTTTPAV